MSPLSSSVRKGKETGKQGRRKGKQEERKDKEEPAVLAACSREPAGTVAAGKPQGASQF